VATAVMTLGRATATRAPAANLATAAAALAEDKAATVQVAEADNLEDTVLPAAMTATAAEAQADNRADMVPLAVRPVVMIATAVVDRVDRVEDRVDTVPPVQMTAMPAAADRVHRAVARADMVHLAVARADMVHLAVDRAVLAVRPVEMIATAVEAKTALAARVVMAVDNNNNKVAMVVEHKAATVNKAETKAIIRRGIVFWDGVGCLFFEVGGTFLSGVFFFLQHLS
jgi:hypothetical protein